MHLKMRRVCVCARLLTLCLTLCDPVTYSPLVLGGQSAFPDSRKTMMRVRAHITAPAGESRGKHENKAERIVGTSK